MVYRGPIKQADLDKLTNQNNGDVYTITDKENKEVVWYKAPDATTGAWADLGYDDAHAHSVTLNGTEKTFDSNGKVSFNLTYEIPANTGTAYNRISKSGSLSDPQHTHALTGAPSISTASSEVAVSSPTTEETPTYTPKGTVSAVSFSDYATGINGAIYTPKGNLTGGSASIPANKVVTDVSVTSDAIKSVKINTSEVFDNIGLIYDVEANAKDVSVSGDIPKNSFLTDLTKNSAQDFTLSGTATTTTASYTPAGSVGRSAKTLASVSGEILTLTSSVQEATGTFSGTPATITPTLKTGSKSVTPIFTGTGTMLKYTKATGATIGNLAISKASTGLTHTDPVFGTTTVVTEIAYDDPRQITVE